MVAAKKIMTVLIVTSALTVVTSASMTPVSPSVGAPSRVSPVLYRTSSEPTDVFSVSDDWPCHGGLVSLTAPFLPQTKAEAGLAEKTKAPQVLADNQSSLSLCLYVLMGIGLCKVVPSVRKLPLDCVPDWYHSGGPFQLGHRYALSPDCLTHTPVCCFIQPDCKGENPMPQFRREMIVSLWRKSQCTPAIFACRGPPLHP
jgi:hypothetical protein